MQRRGFLAGILAAASAPALVRAGFLMPVRKIALPAPFTIRPANANAAWTDVTMTNDGYSMRVFQNGILVQDGPGLSFTPTEAGNVEFEVYKLRLA